MPAEFRLNSWKSETATVKPKTSCGRKRPGGRSRPTHVKIDTRDGKCRLLTADDKMWRFLDGVRPPPTKKSSVDKQKVSQTYEREKRKRDFQESWQDGREWLEFCEEEGSMRCKACRLHPRNEADRTRSFFVGTHSLKLENVQSHERSQAHLWSLTCERNKNKKREETPGGRAISQMSASEIATNSNLIKTQKMHFFKLFHVIYVRTSKFSTGLVDFRNN